MRVGTGLPYSKLSLGGFGFVLPVVAIGEISPHYLESRWVTGLKLSVVVFGREEGKEDALVSKKKRVILVLPSFLYLP